MLPLPSLTWPQNIGTNIKRAWAAKCQLYRSTAGGGGRKGQGASACWSWLQFELFETISLKNAIQFQTMMTKNHSSQAGCLSVSLSHSTSLSLSLTHFLAGSLSVSVSCWLFQGLGQTGVCQRSVVCRAYRQNWPHSGHVCVCVYVCGPPS